MMIPGLEKHIELQVYIEKFEKSKRECDFFSMLISLRACIEYIVDQYHKEYSLCIEGSILERVANLRHVLPDETIKFLSSFIYSERKVRYAAEILRDRDENEYCEELDKLYRVLLEYLSDFLKEFPTPSIKSLRRPGEEVIKCALEEGFYRAAIVDTKSIVFDPSFRPYCEENLCGQYNANYTCPPICGSPEEMRNRILKYEKALVLQSVWNIADYSDKPAIKHAKTEHNAATIRLVKRLREEGHDGVIVGSSGCALCSPCAINEGKSCRFPEFAFSCMSAYCIYVKHLAEICEMTYTCEDGKLALFGMYAFD